MEICQSCGRQIMGGEQAIAIKYGRMRKTGDYLNSKRGTTDYFHRRCEVGLRSLGYE